MRNDDAHSPLTSSCHKHVIVSDASPGGRTVHDRAGQPAAAWKVLHSSLATVEERWMRTPLTKREHRAAIVFAGGRKGQLRSKRFGAISGCEPVGGTSGGQAAGRCGAQQPGFSCAGAVGQDGRSQNHVAGRLRDVYLIAVMVVQRRLLMELSHQDSWLSSRLRELVVMRWP
jgi:hypothetical protein